MFIAQNWIDYEVIDTSNGEKLERWGDFYLVRPDPQVIWNTPKKINTGNIFMDIITEVPKAVENGNFSIYQNNGIFNIKVLH